MHQLFGDIDLPDMVDVEDEYFFVEYIGEVVVVVVGQKHISVTTVCVCAQQSGGCYLC